MNAEQFVRILDQDFIGSLRDRGKDISQVILQQDNDKKHTSKLARGYYENRGIEVLPWAAQSADMSIIEHCWDTVDRQIRSRQPLPTNKGELWAAVQEKWAKMDIGYIRKLYESMPKRVKILDDVEGSYTKY